MESECVVCGSPHDSQALRCIVCGVDLPPTLMRSQTQNGDMNTLTSLQGLSSPLKLPLSTGVAFYKELSEELDQDDDELIMNHEQDLLLGPEELSISSPPHSLSEDLIEESSTLSGIPALSIDELLLNRQNQQNQQNLDPKTSIGAPQQDHSSPHDVAGLRISKSTWEDEAFEQAHSVPSHNQDDPSSNDLAFSQTWVGVPIPQDLMSSNQELSRAPARLQDEEFRPRSSREDSVPNQMSLSSLSHSSTQIGMNYLEGLSSTELEPVKSNEVSSSLPYRISHLSNSASNAPNPLEARYSSHLEEQSRRGLSQSDQVIPKSLVTTTSQDDESSSDYIYPIPEVDELKSPSEEPASFVIEEPEIKDHSKHTTTAELKPYRENPKPTWGLWIALVLVSIVLGVYLTTYFEKTQKTQTDATLTISEMTESKVQVSDIKYHLGQYQIQVKLSSAKVAQLLIPDSWKTIEGEENLAALSGERSVVFELSKDQLHLGANTLNAQWLFVGNEVSPPQPVELAIWLDWELVNINLSSKNNELHALIKVNEGKQLSGADVPFEPATQNDQYFVKIPKDRIKTLASGEQIVTAKLTFKNSVDHQSQEGVSTRELTLWWPHEPSRLLIHSPTQNYARTDALVKVQGRSEPHAIARVKKLIQDTQEISLDELIETQADAQGRFLLDVPLVVKEGVTIPLDGLIWTIQLEVVSPGKLPTSRSIQVKRSHPPTWNAYINRLRQRRDSATQRYTKFKQFALMEHPDQWHQRAGVISGTISWIDRGLTPQEAQEQANTKARPQRFLLRTCSEGDGCPVWVRDPAAFWIELGQTVYVFGTFDGLQSHLDDRGTEVTYPEIKVRLTTP